MTRGPYARRMGTVAGTPHSYARRLRRARERGWWADAALALVLSAATVALAFADSDVNSHDTAVHVLRDFPMPPPPGWEPPPEPGGFDIVRGVASNLVVTAALAVRRRWPLACVAVQFFALLALDPDGNIATLCAVLAGAYSLAVHGRSALLSLGALLLAGGAIAAAESNTWPRLPGWVGIFALLLPVGLSGLAIRAARSRAHESQQRAEALERSQEAATRLAVARERSRIARELHDVVSHHVSVMTIQAGAAGKVLDADPGLARGALAAIESSGRETMAELRHLLGVLSPAGDSGEPLEPQPGLAQVGALAEQVRRAGQPVTLTCPPVPLPHGLDLAAYRVVQEALTNALRHAPGAATTVAVTPGPGPLLIEVTNDAPPPGARPAGPGAGTGLLGLRERLALYGGTLETGPRPDGGFRLRARIPAEREDR